MKYPNTIKQTIEALRTQDKASILAAEGTKCIGVLAMSDVLRPEAKGMVDRLHSMNTDIVLLTGDNQKTADYFARQVGIKQVRAQLLPGEKVSNITAIQNEGKAVCMIGDGVNDASALKAANVGVAMGGLGSDIAVDAADIVLMSDDISKLPYLKRLSNATVKTIKFSIGLSMCILNISEHFLKGRPSLNGFTGFTGIFISINNDHFLTIRKSCQHIFLTFQAVSVHLHLCADPRIQNTAFSISVHNSYLQNLLLENILCNTNS